MRKSLPLRILCLWISCILVVGNLCNAPMPPKITKGSYPCEGDGCGCRNAEDCMRHCCCRSHAPIKDECHGNDVVGARPTPNMAGFQHAVPLLKYSFLRSLTCLGHPNKFSPLSNLVFLPQDIYVIPRETPQGFTKENTFAVLIQGCISPPEKPPRPLAKLIKS